MTRQRLLEEIRRIQKEKKLTVDRIAYDEFLLQPEFQYLIHDFNKYKLKKERWHQIVRFALSDEEEHRYMYSRLRQLVLRYRSGNDEYFMLKTERGTVPFPDRISDINKLMSIYKEFFIIFRRIIRDINSDYLMKKSSQNFVRGKIDWNYTIKNNHYPHPVRFQLIKWQREFDVPENILLILATLWLNKKCRTLLKDTYPEPLEKIEVGILNFIIQRTTTILKLFPFQEVIGKVKKFKSLAYNDDRIIELEKMTEFRISQGLVKNRAYLSLLHWIKKFKEMDIHMLSINKTNFPLETLKNLDTIYEAWIFFEMIDFFSKLKIRIKMELKKKPNYFEIKYQSYTIKFFYEKEFEKNSKYAWILRSVPDFTVMQDDKIIAVFDAKNYSKSSKFKREAEYQILGYMANLDCGLGGLFFPNFSFEEFKYPRPNDIPKHHDRLYVGHYKMQPRDSQEVIQIKNTNISKIFKEIKLIIGIE